MITKEELDELRAMHKRMGELFARVEAMRSDCQNCGFNKNGYCSECCADIPPDYDGKCEKWWFDDIPF